MRKIPFCKASIGRDEYKAVKKVMKSGWITTGAVTKQFEDEFAAYVGAKYAVAVSSCTIALELALKRLGLKKGDPVIAPSFTFCATTQAIEHSNGLVVFGDVDPETLCLDPNSPIVKEALKYAKAVVPVHLGGNKAFTDYSIPVVEDSAHRIEKDQCKDNKNTVCFSFYPTKNMTTGEGGMICTNSKEDYEWFLKARSHGRTKLAGHGYDVLFSGWKANLPDILSAIGLVQIRKLSKMTKERNRVVALYNKLLGNNWLGNHVYPIFRKERDKFIKYMADNGVQCSAHFFPLHKMTAYKAYNGWNLPITDMVGDCEISLPLYPDLKDRDVKYICKLIKEYE